MRIALTSVGTTFLVSAALALVAFGNTISDVRIIATALIGIGFLLAPVSLDKA